MDAAIFKGHFEVFDDAGVFGACDRLQRRGYLEEAFFVFCDLTGGASFATLETTFLTFARKCFNGELDAIFFISSSVVS